jgi:hypothetical protein
VFINLLEHLFFFRQQNRELSRLDELSGKANYLIGNDRKKWRTNVPLYAKVRYREVYPGVDLVYYGNQRQVEHDFIVAPGADPRSITLNLAGAEKLSLDPQGALVLAVKDGEVRFEKPRIYQEVDGARREISGGYVLKNADNVGFQIATYDANKPLVIDPTLFYSTYLGGISNEVGLGIAVDSAGNAYVTGYTQSTTIPTFPTTPGAFQTTNGGNDDVFVTKLNPTGSAPLVYSTFLGGSLNEFGQGIAVDSAGNAYVTGYTCSSNFPTTPSAFQTALQGICNAFVTKLNPTGSAPLYSTYLGGNNMDIGQGIAVDPAGNAYVTGDTKSTNFPTTPGAFQTTNRGHPRRLRDSTKSPWDRTACLLHLPRWGRPGRGPRHSRGRLGQRLRDGGHAVDQFPDDPCRVPNYLSGRH